MWELSPALRGVGYGQVLASACVVSYYCSLIGEFIMNGSWAWDIGKIFTHKYFSGLSFYYLFVSCQAVLPWTICHPELQDPDVICVPSSSGSPAENATTVEESMKNVTFFIASSEQYFKAGVLKERSDISEGIGLPDAAQSGCLVLTWLVIFVSLCRGEAGEHGTS